MTCEQTPSSQSNGARNQASLVLVLLSAMTGFGCATKPTELPPIPCSLPHEAMSPCSQMCQVRPEIVNLELEDQLAMVQACDIANAHAYAKCGAEKLAIIDALKDCASR